jgi:hypothetical protein
VTEALLELVCSALRTDSDGLRRRCGQWLMRWTADLDRPFDEQLTRAHDGRLYARGDVPSSGVLRVESPGMVDGDADWPIPAAAVDLLGARAGQRWMPEGMTGDEEWSRWTFICPNGCRSNVQARVDKLDTAATKVLRELYDTRMTEVLCTTVDKLLAFRL